jgi:Zn-dependent protease
VNIRQGSIRLFRFAGITVFLHWSWFLLAAYEVSDRAKSYSSPAWSVLEYLALFAIVTMHEFGHALAGRQVGGTSDHIVLWPLGGVAYVNPPPRPGATLWSLAAGPLVNVALFPILYGLYFLAGAAGWEQSRPDAYHFLFVVWAIDVGLFVFNMLPIYPLDGGQILRSLLWFGVGRARSLMAATMVGFIGVAGLIMLAVVRQSIWYGIICAFILLNCWSGLQHAFALARFAKLPRHEGFACPACKTSPPIGNFWVCGQCGNAFDTFRTQAVCPRCGAQFSTTGCLDCGRSHPVNQWVVPVIVYNGEAQSVKGLS